MYGDVVYDTMLLYALMVVGFSTLCFGTIKLKQFPAVISGNILSSILSYVCIQQFHTENWNWYFKPFTAKGLLIAISGVAFLIQLIYVYNNYKKQQTK